MRITIEIDEKRVVEAQRVTGIAGRMELIHEGLKALIHRESARQLVRLAGSNP